MDAKTWHFMKPALPCGADIEKGADQGRNGPVAGSDRLQGASVSQQ